MKSLSNPRCLPDNIIFRCFSVKNEEEALKIKQREAPNSTEECFFYSNGKQNYLYLPSSVKPEA